MKMRSHLLEIVCRKRKSHARFSPSLPALPGFLATMTIHLVLLMAPIEALPASDQTATSTRYWDCAGGACGCAYLPNHLNGNQKLPAHCYSNALFAAPPNNIHGAKFYGTAAVSRALGGAGWLGEGCGKCWKVTGTCNTPGCTAGDSTLVLRGANFCPPCATHCDSGAHFDIAAPGFDVSAFSISNDCKNLEPKESEGFEACSKWMINSQDPKVNCECDRFKDDVLRKGCENFLGLGWDNPLLNYEEVTCPDEMVTPCWEDNGNGYPPFMQTPETCVSTTATGPTPAPVPDGPTPPGPTPPGPTPPGPTPPSGCPDGWNTASWTWYQSYAPCCPDSPNYDPDYDTTECDKYSACDYTGSFAYAGQRDYDWVSQNDLIAFFSSYGVKDNESYGNKKIKIKAKSKTVTAWIVDTCGDHDCDGCCTENAQPSGYLVDMESHTVERYFGSLDEAAGEVCWKLDDSPLTGYCSWYQCNGSIQDDPYCNFDSHNCLGASCGGTYYCPTGSTPNPTPAPIKPSQSTSPPTNNPTTSSNCPGQHNLVVEFKTDKNSKENKYTLYRYQQEKEKWKKVLTEKNLEKDELNVNSHCIDMLECYNFKITDKKGDGVKGWYRLILDDILIEEVTDWKKGKKEEHKFGTCPRP